VSIVLLAAMILVADRATKEIALRKLGSRRHGHGVVCVVFTERPLLARGISLRGLVILWFAAVACAVGALWYAPALQQNVFVAAGIAAALAGSVRQPRRPGHSRRRGGFRCPWPVAGVQSRRCCDSGRSGGC
jgi:hypothetical protein